MQKKVIAIAHAAGKLLMLYYGKTTDQYKTKRVSALSLVTAADYASERLIVCEFIVKYYDYWDDF